MGVGEGPGVDVDPGVFDGPGPGVKVGILEGVLVGIGVGGGNVVRSRIKILPPE